MSNLIGKMPPANTVVRRHVRQRPFAIVENDVTVMVIGMFEKLGTQFFGTHYEVIKAALTDIRLEKADGLYGTVDDFKVKSGSRAPHRKTDQHFP